MIRERPVEQLQLLVTRHLTNLKCAFKLAIITCPGAKNARFNHPIIVTSVIQRERPPISSCARGEVPLLPTTYYSTPPPSPTTNEPSPRAGKLPQLTALDLAIHKRNHLSICQKAKLKCWYYCSLRITLIN